MAAKKQSAPVKVEGKAAKIHMPDAPAAPAYELQGLEPEVDKRVTDLTYEEKMRKISALRQKNPETFVDIDAMSSPYILRRPTGIISLDIALAGGFPAGGASCLSGPFGSTKSNLLWRMCGLQQRLYGNAFACAIAHVEGAIDYLYMHNSGFKISVPDGVIDDLNKVLRNERRPELTNEQVDSYKRQVGIVEVIKGDTGDDVLQGVLNANKENVFNIVAVDSISGLQSRFDADKTMDEDSKRAGAASMMKEFWLRFNPMMRAGTNVTTTMLVQQVVQRDKANAGYAAKYLPEWEAKGSEATKHYKLIDLTVYSGAQQKVGDEVVGKAIHWKTAKGKAGTHDNVAGTYNYYWKWFGTDEAGELLQAAYHYSVIMHFGDGLRVTDPATRQPIEPTCYKTDREIRERIWTDLTFEFFLRQEILKAAGVQCLYR
jgi:RecA/RadA recombinase